MITWVFLRPARLVESRQIANQRQKRPGGPLTGLTSSTTKAIKTTKKSFSFVIIISVTLLLSRQRMQQIPSATLPPPSQGGTHSPEGPPKPPRLSTSNLRKLGDGGTASDDGGGGSQPGGGSRKPRRRESHSRRHTLQSGIDYGLLKRMKAIEEERDVLMRGIQTVQRAEEWYNEQLAQVVKRYKNKQIKKTERENNDLRCKRGCEVLVSTEGATKDQSQSVPPRLTGSGSFFKTQGGKYHSVSETWKSLDAGVKVFSESTWPCGLLWIILFFVQDSGGEPAPELSDGVRYVLPPQHEPGSGKINYHRPLPSDMGVNEST